MWLPFRRHFNLKFLKWNRLTYPVASLVRVKNCQPQILAYVATTHLPRTLVLHVLLCVAISMTVTISFHVPTCLALYCWVVPIGIAIWETLYKGGGWNQTMAIVYIGLVGAGSFVFFFLFIFLFFLVGLATWGFV